MKKIAAIVIVLVSLCSVVLSNAESTNAADITYKTLYECMLQAMKDTDDNADDMLVVENATVWKVSDDLAGFSFQGPDWQVFGETDMTTGIITRLFCRMPYTKAGLMMTYMTAYVLSEESSPTEFISNYVGENSMLTGKPFPHYANTLDAGNETTIVYEFTRVGSVSLENPENQCDMTQLIAKIQAF